MYNKNDNDLLHSEKGEFVMPEALLMPTNSRLRRCYGHFHNQTSTSSFNEEALDGIVAIQISDEILDNDLSIETVIQVMGHLAPFATPVE